jgi:hypothetical protein
MNFRDIVDKLTGNYRKSPKTQEEVVMERERQLLARINFGKPLRGYFTHEGNNLALVNYNREYSSMAVKALKLRHGRLAEEEH